MYVDVKMSKKGEIVIPAFVRRQFKFKEGGSVRLDIERNSIHLVTPTTDFIAWIKETAKKEAIPTKNIIIGNPLYEEDF